MLLFIAVLLSITTLPLFSAGAAVQTQDSSARHKRDESKVDLDALKENLASIEDGLSNFQKRSCSVGLNSHHCIFQDLDDVMSSQDYLRGGYSPGKRDTQLPGDVQAKAEGLLHNLSEQMKAVMTLRRLLNQLGQDTKQEEKRTCQFRLGNHCLTEALDRAASQYYYLRSPLSPGRRKREAVETEEQQMEDIVFL